ncbi:MAG TPA: energy transducer TonB [Candidatus Kapabacteria bacterium]|nr:energy transducer TonB [Candidatus Kapabacteria bacterium]
MRVAGRISLSIATVMLCAAMQGWAQPRRHGAPRAATNAPVTIPAGMPYPAFEFDSVRYFVHPEQGVLPMQTEGRARAVVRVDARGRTTIVIDPRSDERFGRILAEGLGYVRFRPAQQGGHPVPSAVAVTAWFMLDRSHKVPVPFADIVLDSAHHAADTIVRPTRRPGMPVELEPVYNRSELASNILYPDGVPPASQPDTVMVRVLVERDGSVAHAMAEGARNPLLGLAAEQAARSTRFAPAMQLGAPLALWVTIPVIFRWKQ